LRDILRDYPDNAAANHYWIHAVEASEHPERALESARKLGSLAPGSGHMVHMPGHIFYRTGDYGSARKCFLDSMQVDEAYMRAQKRAPEDDRNYAHNLSYLIANSAEEGRSREAREYAARLEPLAHSATDASHPGSAVFYVVQIGGTRSRLAIRFGERQEAIEHPVAFGIPENEKAGAARALRDGMVIYAKAMESLERDDADGGARESDRLDALLWRFMRDREQTDRTAQRVGEILGVASKELGGSVASHRGD